MNTKGNNRSVMRTKALFKKGLSDLMLQKPPGEITVRELADYVNLNRGTFYLHYKGIYDLLEQMEDELITDFQTILMQHRADDMQGMPLSMLYDIYRLLAQNADFCRALLSDKGWLPFFEKIKVLVKEKCFEDWSHLFPHRDSASYEAYYSFMLSGTLGLLEYWLLSGMEQPVEEIASQTERFILHGMDSLSG
ncbi:MAG: TetR/AcrR family transcriptional regulator C-terminal domain-containing protein [Eubacteriales bacterium]|nr:TetR/AcrR family transcriptional regulator C-terminal domain-containing protein [Eubacteriales bacterium]